MLLIFVALIVFVLVIGIWRAEKTNPYSPHTEMTPAYIAELDNNNQFVLHKSHALFINSDVFSILIVKLQAALRIVSNAWNPIKPLSGSDASIAKQIHTERFDPSKAYLISGEHFADFYPRNYGIFYSATLDPRIQISQKDWENRQKVMLQTTAMYLDILSQSNKPYTTYMPLSNTTFVGTNIWFYPSDSLYSVLFQLSCLTNDKFLQQQTLFATTSAYIYPLQTQRAGGKLLKQYSSTLKRHVTSYEDYVLDPKTRLVKKDIFLSGVRDGFKGESSFYNNVIAWATAKLSSDLGILPKDKKYFEQWKQKIISAFWDNAHGIFLDDLSTDSRKQHIFPSEAYIITQTQFLDPNNPDDKTKILSMNTYVRNNKLDQPFPLPWAEHTKPEKLVFIDRYIVPNYESSARFSHWTMEYIKLLAPLFKENPEFIEQAKTYLNIYKKNIEKYGGYPEIYHADGAIFQSFFYKSVLHTGWIINYEQTRLMIDSY
jgi:hypothetical protein